MNSAAAYDDGAQDGDSELSHESLEIIDLDTFESTKDDETWLLSSPNRNVPEIKNPVVDWTSGDIDSGEIGLTSKKSLVNKLEIISKGSPTRFSSTSSSSYGVPSPSMATFLSRHNLSSTPMGKTANASRSNFDSRTFSRSSGNRALLNRTYEFGDDSDGILSSSPIKFNQTSFYKISSPHLMSDTYDKDPSPGPGLRLNETFDQKSFFRLASPHLLNSTFDKEPSQGQFGSTFRKGDSPLVGGAMNETYGKDESLPGINATYRKDNSPPIAGAPLYATFRKDDLIPGMNSTYGMSNVGNGTFDLGQRGSAANTTFEVRNSGVGVNTTFEVRNSGGGANSTFEIRPSGVDPNRKLSEDRLSSTSTNSNNHYMTHRLSRDSSHDLLDDADRLSTTSESSVSHRLNDVGDVQHIARMQEESLRQPIIPSSHRSATISPSSEHSANSPSTEGYMTGNNMGYQSEEGGVEKGAIGGGGGSHQYSSQDSLPDSPYSSQSLDVQPLSEQDRLRRSMPNLNKIRGHSGRGGAVGGGSGLTRGGGAGVAQRPTYGALSRQHASDPRLQAGTSRLRFQAPPARGTTVTSSNEYSLAPPRYGSASGVQPPRQYGFSGAPQAPNPSQAGWGQTMALPKTGIPRPGSRIPGPRTTSGIPKPGGGGYSQPGSRASSQGPSKMSYDNYY